MSASKQALKPEADRMQDRPGVLRILTRCKAIGGIYVERKAFCTARVGAELLMQF